MCISPPFIALINHSESQELLLLPLATNRNTVFQSNSEMSVRLDPALLDFHTITGSPKDLLKHLIHYLMLTSAGLRTISSPFTLHMKIIKVNVLCFIDFHP